LGSYQALTILALGILALVVSLTITDRKKFLLGVVLSGLIILLGVSQFVATGIQRWKSERRLSQLRQQQQSNLKLSESAFANRFSAGIPAQPPLPEKKRSIYFPVSFLEGTCFLQFR